MGDYQDRRACPLAIYILKSRHFVEEILNPLEKGSMGLRFDSPENFVISICATVLRNKHMLL